MEPEQMRVNVTEAALVVVTPAENRVYQPGEYLLPRALVEQIEAQKKGERIPPAPDSALSKTPAPPAPAPPGEASA